MSNTCRMHVEYVSNTWVELMEPPTSEKRQQNWFYYGTVAPVKRLTDSRKSITVASPKAACCH